MPPSMGLVPGVGLVGQYALLRWRRHARPARCPLLVHVMGECVDSHWADRGRRNTRALGGHWVLRPWCLVHIIQGILCNFQSREINTRGSRWFRPQNAKRALENKKRAPENCNRLQCKSLFNVADLVNGMWKVAPENKKLIFGLLQRTQWEKDSTVNSA